MFSSNSRYFPLTRYTITTADGREVTATRLPLPQSLPLAGFHRRVQGDRLDLLAARFLHDPTAFFLLCDANNTPSSDALAARDLIGIPRGQSKP